MATALYINLHVVRSKTVTPLHTKVLLTLSSQDYLLVFIKTDRVVMESEKLVDLHCSYRHVECPE